MARPKLHAVGSAFDTFHHVRLNRFVDMQPELLADSLGQFKNEQLPSLARVPGFRTIFFGVDLTNGKAAGITFWESEADLRASERTEEAARKLALARAGGNLGKGLVDGYSVLLERRGERQTSGLWARLARWEGVRPERIRGAMAQFEERDLPLLEDTSGFCGLFVGVNWLLGNTLSVSLWASKADLDASLDWERQARHGVESRSGLVPRAVIADTYEVALVPQLRQLHERSAWTDARTDARAALVH